jgi:hypothetical protein
VPTSPLYPGAVRNFGSDVVNFTDTILADHVNILRAEVNSVQTVLGTYLTLSSGWTGSFTRPNISTTWNSLKDRLANIEYGLNTAYSARTPVGGSSGQVLVKSSSSDYDFAWTTFTGLPSQSGNTGKFLTTMVVLLLGHLLAKFLLSQVQVVNTLHQTVLPLLGVQ